MRKCDVVALAIVLASVCCMPVRAQVDFSSLDKYRGLNNQRPSGGNSNQSGAPAAQDPRQAAANSANAEGLAAEDKGDWVTAEAQFRKALQAAPNDPVIRQNLAVAQTHVGGDAYRRGDYVTALNFFQQALANDPASDKEGRESISRNLAFIQQAVDSARRDQEQRQAAAKREQEQRRQDKVIAARMQQDIQNLAESLNSRPGAATSSGGLDFKSNGATSNQVATAPAMEFGDPMVVDARHVPTGLPKSVADEIPDTPAGNRVRKGFQAIVAHDWNVAQAWFRDALNHDPGNAGIQRLVELADYTMERERHPSASAPPRTAPPDTRARDKAATAALDANLDNVMDADLAKAFDDFNRNYLPKHPGLTNPATAKGGSLSALDPASDGDSARWKIFFGTLFSAPLTTAESGAVRN